ncbi:Phospholipase [Quillaja saponaria]|uniref:phospholipase D n=1 Tax=Quillaja saponaria TaxID=32244 RepID=A0AAD7QGA7_QUISA|nr:Phospholipase [Quillaja saponaria]
MYWQYQTICRGHYSILHNLYDLLGPKTYDFISFYGLRASGRLFDGGSVASSQVYVHSEIMIIDDCTTLIGSANINDRSLLGSRDSEVNQINDPIVDSTYKDIWMATAKTNTTIYQDVFSCIPNDLIHTRAAFRQSTAFWKEKLGHSTIDLGIAHEKLESYHNGDIKSTDPMERLASVRGHLVSFPLNFMCKEDLRPALSKSEYHASQVFH